MALTELFDASFQRRRDEVALGFRDRALTFGDLDTAALEAACRASPASFKVPRLHRRR